MDFINKNKIREFIHDKNITERLQRTQQIIEQGINVKNSKKLQKELEADLTKIISDADRGFVNNVEIADLTVDSQWAQDDVMFFGFVGVVMMAVVGTIAENFFKSTKKDQIEFELDNETCPVPTQQESKKAIKKTLNNIMAKNNAKTTLIAWYDP